MGASLFFFLSGLATLAAETYWLRQNAAVFGAAAASAGALLFAWFGGTALGAFVSRRIGLVFRPGRLSALFLLTYAFSFAAYAFMPALWAPLVHSLKPALSVLLLAKILCTALALLPAAFVTGTLFPMAARAQEGTRLTGLYSWNALGAVLGILLSINLPAATGYRALFLCAFVAAVAAPLLLWRPATPARSYSAPRAALPGRVLAAGFGSGFLSILLEVVWIRWMSLGTDNTVYSFAAVTLLLLGLIFLLSALAARLPGAILKSPWLLPAVAGGAALMMALSCRLFSSATQGLHTVIIDRADSLAGFAFALRFLPAAMVFTALFFPLLLRTAFRDHPGADAASLFGFNGLGAALGALAGVLLPKFLGLWGVAFACSLLYALLALFLARKQWVRMMAAAVLLGIVFFNPLKLPRITPDPLAANLPAPARVMDIVEGGFGIVSVVDFGPQRTLWLNSTYLLGGNRSPADDRRMGLLPSLLKPDGKSACVIGLATGITLSGVLKGGAERAVCVELVPAVADMARKWYGRDNLNALSDPRLKLVLDDGRHFLRYTRERFDLVVSDLFVPWHEGTSALYTRDHFSSVCKALAPGGLFALWLPLYELTLEEFAVIARTFTDVFPRATLWQNAFTPRGPAVVLAGGLSPLDMDLIAADIVTRSANPGADLAERDPAGAWCRFLCDLRPEDGWISNAPLNTLDRPVLEFMAAKKERRLLAGSDYLALVNRLGGQLVRIGTFDTLPRWEFESYRKAGHALLGSVFALQNGDREAAYRLFSEYQALVPEVLRTP